MLSRARSAAVADSDQGHIVRQLVAARSDWCVSEFEWVTVVFALCSLQLAADRCAWLVTTVFESGSPAGVSELRFGTCPA